MKLSSVMRSKKYIEQTDIAVLKNIVMPWLVSYCYLSGG